MARGSVEQRVAALLEEAAETHHRVYRITDGSDADWASWYAGWLLDLSELGDELGCRPVRSHLVQCDLDYTQAGTDEAWPRVYARELTRRLWT